MKCFDKLSTCILVFIPLHIGPVNNKFILSVSVSLLFPFLHQRISKRTEELQSGAEDFASLANELVKAMEGRKWYQI